MVELILNSLDLLKEAEEQKLSKYHERRTERWVGDQTQSYGGELSGIRVTWQSVHQVGAMATRKTFKWTIRASNG